MERSLFAFYFQDIHREQQILYVQRCPVALSTGRFCFGASKPIRSGQLAGAVRRNTIDEKNLFVDKQSGKDFQRPQYQKLIRKLKKDDLLVVKSIDRLGRNYAEILEQWRFLTREKGIDIVVLDMPLLDTRRGKDLMGTFLSDIVLQVLSFVAENERSNIRQRQAEGIAAARARGVRFGRPSAPLPEDFPQIYRQWKSGSISGTTAARMCGMPLSSFRYRAQIYENQNVL